MKNITNTSIIATLGPASKKESVIRKLINAGVSIFRINFSHGEYFEHLSKIEIIKKISKTMDVPVAILGDLCGPKIRVGLFANGKVLLKKDQIFSICSGVEFIGSNLKCWTNYKYLPTDLKEGDEVLVDDGKIVLKVIVHSSDEVQFKVLNGGWLKDNKGINLPRIHLTAKPITGKDKKDLKFIIENHLDFVALSFITGRNDILELRKLCKKSQIKIIAKIEKPEAVDNIDSIIEVADAVMIARGDLGVEMPLEQVPLIQKVVINKCRESGVPVIIATQMLESMIKSDRPLRAETSDIYNSIIDGTDAVMLSGETAVGHNPVLTVKTMAKIISEAERNQQRQKKTISIKSSIKNNVFESTAYICCQSAIDIEAKSIIAFTKSGSTALRIASYHSLVPVLALVYDDNVYRQLNLCYGVIPIKTKVFSSIDDVFLEANKVVKKSKLAVKGDSIIIVAGFPFHQGGATNLVKFHQVH